MQIIIAGRAPTVLIRAKPVVEGADSQGTNVVQALIRELMRPHCHSAVDRSLCVEGRRGRPAAVGRAHHVVDFADGSIAELDSGLVASALEFSGNRTDPFGGERDADAVLVVERLHRMRVRLDIQSTVNDRTLGQPGLRDLLGIPNQVERPVCIRVQ